MTDYTIPTSNTVTTIDPQATKIRELQSDVTELENRLRALWDKLEGERQHYMDRIKRLEEQLMESKNKYAMLVSDVVLNEDRAERIKQLEDRIHRAASAFFRDGSDGHVASQMLQILEEERGKK
jgi:DNA repair exonuclease SbcCD ATPase subunit